ncbi:RNA polymerase sigma factor [Desulfurispirillum indicum]|uniref:RNA polymerase sigma factor n=1 Tax=Desulfurispirillum indicum TaxID=936456 RepID=UPI001CFAD80A|nr:RNA polymerase sigma factor [Desulfurispirillum indicum]UCZ56244.1 RNA polymerase sigma factor [Desulfurispirillum indicum]
MSDQNPHDIYRNHHKDILRYFSSRVSSSGTAADLTQETFLRLLRSSISLLNPKAYLLKVAHNVLIDYYRSASHMPVEDISPEELESAMGRAPSAEDTALSREELAVLMEAIAELPPRAREVFRLKRLEGLSYSEIGQQLGITRSTIMEHMARALTHCTRRLDEYATQQEKS